MKKMLKRIAVAACAAALGVTSVAAFAGCSSSSSDETVKIGVLVADVSGEEALAFRSYYEDYIAKQYDVTFTYTDALSDAAGEKSAIESFAAQGYDAIISLSSNDRATQVETCEEYGMYYAVASGMMDDDVFETYKSYEYFVGQIGPSMDTEYDAGLAMGEYYAEKDMDCVAIYGAFIPNSMHVYRMAGLLTGLGITYDGYTGSDIVTAIYADSGVDSTKLAKSGMTIYYMTSYTDSTYTELSTIIAAAPDAYLSVGMATTFFASSLDAAGIPYADIDSFTSTNGELMNSGCLEYLAGKYTSSIGPIFAAVYNAVKGNKIEDDGCAISIGQDYWVATSYDQFEVFQSADSATSPIYNKTLLDTVIVTDSNSVSYSDFEDFVTTDRTPS